MLARLLAVLLALIAPSAAAGTLPRVMSTNLCADVVLLALADPAQIVSVSSRSQDAARSSLAARAAGFAANTGSAEEVLASRPDIVLASRRWQARHPAALFARERIEVVALPFPTNWSGVLRSTRDIGRRIGRAEAAEALASGIERRLAALGSSIPGPNALYLRPNGGTTGSGTHVHAVLEAAGLRNHVADLGRSGWGRIPLEQVVMTPPQVLVLSQMRHDTAFARAGFSRHPAMQEIAASRPALPLPNNDWGCSNWQLVDAVEALAAGRHRSTERDLHP